MKTLLFVLPILILGACARPAVPDLDRRPFLGLGDSKLVVRVLDPGGRLWLHGRGPRVMMRDPANGLIVGGPRFPMVPPDAEIVVLAPGCADAVVPAQASGVQYVRLSPGIPIRLHLRDRKPLPEGLDSFGVALKRKPRPDAWWSDRISDRMAAGTRLLEEDLPSHSDWVRIYGEEDEVLLYAPGPGRYRVTWQTRWPTHGSGYQTQIDLEVTVRRAGEVYELSWPAEWLERNAAMARGEKGR